ncbi:hypothetical protein [Burkholderia gladioli]|uniref:hypothetical protein n=1 Tax=Burkholderia gladioli TaxID=28095 RepID=UPI002FE14ED4
MALPKQKVMADLLAVISMLSSLQFQSRPVDLVELYELPLRELIRLSWKKFRSAEQASAEPVRAGDILEWMRRGASAEMVRQHFSTTRTELARYKRLVPPAKWPPLPGQTSPLRDSILSKWYALPITLDEGERLFMLHDAFPAYSMVQLKRLVNEVTIQA